MQFDKIKQEWEQTQSQIADMRARLLADKKIHLDAIKAIEDLLASMPGAVKAKPKAAEPTAPEAPKGPTIGQEIVELAKATPGIQVAGLVAALPHRPRKSVENTASSLVTKGKLSKDGKGYAVAS